MKTLARFVALFLCMAVASPVPAQRADLAGVQDRQREAMAAFARMDGVWRGPGWALTPDGRQQIVQTERIGPFLDGTIRVMEGRGYNPDGSIGFNAFGVISFDPATGEYRLSSWAEGRSGVFVIRPTGNGYVWEIPAGPGAIFRYTATIEGEVFREVGHRIVEGQEPVQMFEMNLRRVADSDWPTAGAVPMR